MTRDVLHVTPSIGRESGGLGAVTTALAVEQRRHGWNSRIWCTDSPTVVAAATRESSLEGVVLGMPALGPRILAFSPAAEIRARAARFDVVHQHGIWTAQARLTMAMRKRGIPTVIAPHGSLEPYAFARSQWKKKIALRLFERENLEHASCLHATASAEVRTFREFGLHRPIAVVPNGVPEGWVNSPANPARFRHAHGIRDRERILLFVSRIDPKKGLPMLVNALASLPNRPDDWRVVIAGPDEKGHRARVERLAGRERVALDFVGPVFGEEKRDMFAAADVFILPTHSDNFAIVVAEALGAGVPVITTHGAPWEELETHGCGWWVPIDADAIAAAIADAFDSDRERLREMGTRGRELVTQRYTWGAVAARTVALYRWLIGETGTPEFVSMD